MSLQAPPRKFVTVARVVRPRGNKGEVAAELLTDFPERLKNFHEVFLLNATGVPRRIGLKSFWMDRNHPGFCVFQFDGIASIAEGEKLRGTEVQIPFEQRVELPAGQYFVSDLIGCSVFEQRAGVSSVSSSPCSRAEAPAFLGTVKDVYFTGESQPGTPLLAVDTVSGELLVPLAEDFCKKLETAGRRIDVVLPEGFRGINDEP